MNKNQTAPKLLIVDDVRANLDAMESILAAGTSYLIAKAKSGKSAILKAKAQRFDLIILDIIMPEIDGFEVCRQLKAYPGTNDIPIIFITAQTDPKTILKCFKAGAVDYISKPFSPEELVARTRLHLELKETQEALIMERDKAEAMAHARSLFLANMSHDLRSPMNGIMGMTDLLGLTQLDDKQSKYLSTIHISSNNLLQIIDNILDYSKMQAGQIKLENSEFRLEDQLTEAIQCMAYKSNENQIEIDSNINPDIPEYVIGDALRVKQIIINLLDNVIKYSKNGRIEIRIHLTHSTEQYVRLNFEIIDAGGVNIEELKNSVIKSLSNQETTISKSTAETDLSLAISKNLIQLMKGDIGVDQIDKGKSRIWFELKFGRVIANQSNDDEQLSNGENEPSVEQLNILLVDDNTINLDVISFSLQQFGTIDKAENGQIAVDLVKQNVYDVVFMDVQMPIMDGVKATQLIREIEKRNRVENPVKIVALTANNSSEEKKRLFEAGMDGFVAKPFKPKDLQAIISNVQFNKSLIF